MARIINTFTACYELQSGELIGGTSLHLSLQFTGDGASSGLVMGTGVLFRDNPHEIKYNVLGNYFEDELIEETPIRVFLRGLSQSNSIIPIVSLKVNMNLNEDWKNGTGNFEYLNEEGEWVRENATITQVPCLVKTP